MNKNAKELFKLGWKSMLFWTFALGCYAIFRFLGIEDSPGIQIKEELAIQHSFTRPFLVLISIGIVLGVLYAILDFFFDIFISKRLILGLNLILKTLLYFIFTIIVFTIALEIASDAFAIEFNTKLGWWKENRGAWALLFYIVTASIVFSFIKIAIERFGSGTFFKMLLGRYKNPREEDRIFMFLDLKDSTAIAEQLGHHKYSQFIQDCFYDLNEVVLDYNAEIYQYVGDEVVLSWPYQKGLENNNCIGVFFAFEAHRKSKKEFYLKKYKVFPEFKAGLHGGPLMVAEVGFIKKEIAYHGDVINTSARIQAECNKHNVTLLLSEKIMKDIKINLGAKIRFLTNVVLKGKQKKVNIYTINAL